ncbi:hypothetical protein Syun_017659 [Stephania yunnanensis]|uniref:Uncharacterized protein n=1 Tax=Stephania yunnanensis TaxID=152371 RepID=A0AAP0J6Z1_9MAGN
MKELADGFVLFVGLIDFISASVFFDRTKLGHGLLSGKYSVPAQEIAIALDRAVATLDEVVNPGQDVKLDLESITEDVLNLSVSDDPRQLTFCSDNQSIICAKSAA